MEKPGSFSIREDSGVASRSEICKRLMLHGYHCRTLTVPGQTHQHGSVAGVQPTSPSLVG